MYVCSALLIIIIAAEYIFSIACRYYRIYMTFSTVNSHLYPPYKPSF